MNGLTTNYSEGGQYEKQVELSARHDKAPTAVRTNEGKVAKALIGGLDKMSFDTVLFTQMLISEGGRMMRRRILDISIGIIKEFANHWDTGLYNDEVARDAKRLKDTLDQFKM